MSLPKQGFAGGESATGNHRNNAKGAQVELNLGFSFSDLATRAEVARLRTGDWVDLYVHGRWRRAQLSWMSDNGSLFMFVSHGGRAHSMTQRTCEKLMRLRHLRPVEIDPVVERALKRLSEDADSASEPSAASTLA